MRWLRGSALAAAALLTGCATSDVIARPPGFRIGAVLGYDLVPFVPVLYLSNTLTAEEVLDHTYGGRIAEDNGLIYTCRGGFVDMAHLRDCADWTGYVAGRLDRGLPVEMPHQGATRFTVTRRDESRADPAEVAAHVVWTFYVWHEIVTWYGWGTVSVYPEKISAFSPEDVPSNLLGVMVGAAAYRRLRRERITWDAAVRAELEAVMAGLGVTDEATTRRALDAVEGPRGWWDRSRGFPRSAMVRRRNISMALRQVPWQVPDPGRFCRRAGCPHTPRELTLPDRGDDYTLAIEVDADVLERFPLPGGRETRIGPGWFPTVLADLRRAAKAELGPLADRPDRVYDLPVRDGRSVSFYRASDGTWQARATGPRGAIHQRAFSSRSALERHYAGR